VIVALALQVVERDLAAAVQPLTPAVDLMRHLILGSALEEAAGLELVRLVLFAVVGIPIAVYAVSRARRFSRVRGTVLES
jgi:hypothetical protein